MYFKSDSSTRCSPSHIQNHHVPGEVANDNTPTSANKECENNSEASNKVPGDSTSMKGKARATFSSDTGDPSALFDNVDNVETRDTQSKAAGLMDGMLGLDITKLFTHLPS